MNYRLIHADVIGGLRQLPDESVQVCVTSPPYWGLRDYGVVGQLGLERTPDEYVARMVAVFAEVRRVLRKDGTLWVNIGDSYATQRNDNDWLKSGATAVKGWHGGNNKPKDLIGVPWLLALSLRSDGWYLRSDIIWSKPNPMPESVTDRPTKAHEYLFLLSKSAKYFYDHEAIREQNTAGTIARLSSGPVAAIGAAGSKAAEVRGDGGGEYTGRRKTLPETQAKLGRLRDKQRGHSRRHAGFNDRWDAMERSEQIADGRNKRSVWTIATEPFPEAHFATFPTALVEPCILAGSRVGDTVLDPFNGSGTTGVVALSHQRNYVGIDLNADYIAMARRRLSMVAPMFATEITA